MNRRMATMRIVVLVSGTGSNLQSVIDAVASKELADVEIAAVGADKHGTYGVERSEAAGIETFVVNFKDYEDRAEWNHALTQKCQSYQPDYVVSSGFMRIVGEEFINAFDGTYINTHPALLPRSQVRTECVTRLRTVLRSLGARYILPMQGWTPARFCAKNPWQF